MATAKKKIEENTELENKEEFGDADMIAEADGISSEEEDTEELLKNVSFTAKFSKDYKFDGETISELDLNNVVDLTTIDAQRIDRTMDKLKHHPQNKFRDTLYCKHIAMAATGMPVEFFNQLRMRDMNEICSIIQLYFLFGLAPQNN